jgi:hypothetical protein
MRRRGVLDAQASGSARQRRPIAASRSLTGAAVQLPQTGRSCLAQRDRAGKVCYAGQNALSPQLLQGLVSTLLRHWIWNEVLDIGAELRDTCDTRK